jgi:hypothetical protein
MMKKEQTMTRKNVAVVRHHEFGRNAEEAFGYDLVVELALLEGLDLVAVLGDHAARAAERAQKIVDRTLLHHSVSQSVSQRAQKMKRLRAGPQRTR